MSRDASNFAGNPDALSYERRVVAFLDILGFRSFVSEGYSEAIQKIKAIDDALHHTLKSIHEQEDSGWVSIRTFSDCLCLSASEAYLPTFVDAIAFLQYYLGKNGIFVRGGVSEGYHCETSRMIFSEGLVRAYDLQCHELYPRVLIAPELVPKIGRVSYFTDWGPSGSLLEYLLVDGEGTCFLDYLQAVVVAGSLGGDADTFFDEHAQAIRRQLMMHAPHEGVLRKHLWLAKYHNFRVREVFGKSDWEPDDFQELMQRLLIVPSESTGVPIGTKHVCFTRLQAEAGHGS